MNILYDHQIFATQSHGGISRYFFELAKAMSGRPDVTVDLFGGLNITEFDLLSLNSENVHVTSTKRPRIPKTAQAFGVLNSLLLRSGPGRQAHDIYHPTYFDALPDARGTRVLTVYDMAHERVAHGFNASDPTAAQKRRAVEKADAIIAISEATKVDIIEILGVPEEKIRVIHLANSLHERSGMDSAVEGPYILYVGSRGGYKNFELLLRVYAHSIRINSEFRLVCFGGRDFTRDERAVIDAAGLSERVVRLTGDDLQLARAYEHATAFVYPSLYEGFGLPPLEAMYLGCPVLAGRIPPVAEVAGDAALYFDPTSEDELREQLESILADEALRTRLRAAGLGRERRYSWARCADETLAFYRDVAGAPERG